MNIEIKESSTRDTAYDKFIKFTYEGQEYSVFLHWDSYEGYDMNFTELENTGKWISDPDWVEDFDYNGNESLESILDGLTNERESE